MLCMVVGGVNSAWAQETTLWSEDFSSYSANDVPSGGTYSYVCVNGGTNTKIWNENVAGGTAPELLVSKTNGSFTATVPLENIEGDLTLTFLTNKQQISVSTTTEGISGSLSEKLAGEHTLTFTGVTTSMTEIVIVFTGSGSSNVRLDNIVLKGTKVNPGDTRTETSVTIDDSGITNTDVYTSTTAGSLSATVKAGDDAVSGASVTWSSDDTDVATIDASTGVVTLVGAGTVNITAAYAGDETNYKPSSATYELTVTNSDPDQPGTVNNPYTVAQALAADPANGVYVQGTISAITEVSTQYKNATYTISDGTNEMLIYRGRYLDNADFTSADQIQLGDVVKVYGNLAVHNNANQMAQGNYIVNLDRKPTATLAFEQDSYEVAILGALTITATSSDSDGAITYESSDEDIAVIDETTGEVTATSAGVITITARIADTDSYKGTTATVQLTVIDPRQEVTLSFPTTPATINIGQEATYAVTSTPEGLEDLVAYTSSDNDIVSVDLGTGEITANAVGTATIIATFEGDSEYMAATASYTITVVDPSAPTTVYKKVTSTADITDGEYLIVYEGGLKQGEAVPAVAFDGGLGTLDAADNGVGVTISNDEIASSFAVDKATFTIKAVTGGYTIKSPSGKYIDKTANSNGLDVGDTEMVNKSITIDENGNAVITASGGCTLRYNYASDQLRFRYYKSGQQAIALYKKVTGTPETVSVTITSAGAASFSSKYALDFSKVEGLKAYKATSKSDSYVHLDEVEQVPAGAGVIVKGAEGLYFVPVVTGDVAALDGNLLVGTAEATYTVGDDYGKVFKYVKRTSDGVVGFQKAKADWTCQVGHAYLMFSKVQAREFIGIFGDDVVTGISGASLNDNGQMTNDDAPAYNLAGQKVGKGYKGIVIKNGKKVVIK